MRPISAHGGVVMYFESFCFRSELGFLNCNDICMCVVSKQFVPLEFAFNSVYVDLKYNEIYTNFPQIYTIFNYNNKCGLHTTYLRNCLSIKGGQGNTIIMKIYSDLLLLYLLHIFQIIGNCY